MKIAITGHSKGIGHALYSKLADNHTVQGYSRSNGYDISTKQSIIIRSAKDCDVFINNAYSGFAQLEILKGIYNEWRQMSDKTIVNVISRTKYYKVGQTQDDEYCAHKKALDDLCHTLLFRRSKKCRIININPGYVRTDMVSHVPEDTPMLTAEEVADCIAWAIEQPKHIEIAELSMWRP